jgi:3'-phosphoadenosine 5'-phosphosulfate sulfotransferase (PAPS reductase)/FAD synthetase
MLTTGRKRVALVTGARSQESTRRMGHVEPVKVGEWQESADGTRKHVRKNRVWVAPCHDWSAEEQLAYMEWFDLPKNPVKLMLGMSGECFCGAFASPGELDRIRHHCPDVAAKIDRLAEIAKANGRPCVWGTRPDKSKGKVTLPRTGELCSTCDLRAAAAGIDFSETRGTCG